MSQTRKNGSNLHSEPQSGSGKGKRRAKQQNDATALVDAFTGHHDGWPYTIQRTTGYRYVLIHRNLGTIRAYRTKLGAQRAAERHHRDSEHDRNRA